jgi:chemotaxis protein methyltransferase CheR
LLDHAGLPQRATVLGTDISRARLQQAQKARYRNWSLRGVPDDEIARYFRRVGRDFEVAARFTHAVEFAYLNLAEDVYPSLASGVWGMDIIFCRNVLIYFDEEVVRRVSRQLIAALSDDGWLLLGASDPPLHEFPECETVVTEAGLIYRRRREPAVRAPAPAPHTPARIDAQPVRSFAALPEPPAAAAAAGPAITEEAAWVARVRTLANQGHVRDALALVSQALTEHRFSAELLYLQAVLESEQGRARAALASARRAIYLDRDMVVAHILMAQVQNRLGLAVSARRSLINAQTLLEDLPPDQPIPAADGEPAARLAEMVRLQLQFLGDVA